MTDYSLVPANEIWYTTTDGKAIELSATTEEKTVSNTYKDGKGVIVFKEPLTVIKVDYFADCETLQEVVIPSGVNEIEWHAFKNCTGLHEIFIPSTLNRIIGAGAFCGCPNLTKITVEEGNPEYDSREGCNAIIDKSTDRLMFGCRNTVIPSSVTDIEEYAFQGCKNLKEIVIHDSVESIGGHAFQGCEELKEIVIPESVTHIYQYAFGGCTGLEKIVFASSETRIWSKRSFKGCNNLKVIYVPKGSVDYYKEQFPRYMRWLIVEDGSDWPVNEIVAKDVLFALPLRVLVPGNETEDNILLAAKRKLKNMSDREIIKLILEHPDTITDSTKPYNEKEDYEELEKKMRDDEDEDNWDDEEYEDEWEEEEWEEDEWEEEEEEEDDDES